LYLGDGEGGFTEADAGLTGVAGSSTSAADIDGDEEPDMLVTGVSGASLSLSSILYENLFDNISSGGSAPENLAATSGNAKIRLSWTPGPDSSADGYNVYRSTSSFSDISYATKLNNSPISSTSYTDTEVANGTEYFYRVTTVDSSGRESDPSPTTSVLVRQQELNVSITRTFAGASRPSDYRLVALPGSVDRSLKSAITGEPEVVWQAFWDDGSDKDFLLKHEDSELFRFHPGRGFWLTSRQTWTFNSSVKTVPLDEDQVTSIPLHEGWNIISNPFGQDVIWSQVNAAHSDSLRALWRFDGSFAQADTFQSAKTGEAFYFLNDTGIDSLSVPYPSDPSSRAKQKEAGSFLVITAQPAGSESPASTVKVGFDEKAAEGLDRLDQPAPPGQFSAVSLRLKAPGDVPGRQRWLAAERRPPSAGAGEGHTFDLRLQTQMEGPVRINASGLEAVEGSEVELLHPSTGRSYDLRSGETVTLQETDSTALRLAVGSAAYVQNQADKVVPDEVTLTSYPNPMRKQATLEYTLPKAKEVRLTVYDVLGRRVATLEQGEKRAGRHRTRLQGDQLSSGVYFGRFEVGGQTLTQKITVVR
jgi:hypothetical protein